MTPNLSLDFTVNKENKTITLKRDFDAELPLVWDAYTKSEILDQWWAPKPWKARTKKMDFREGGSWLYAMVGPNNEEHWAKVDYISIQPQKKFVCKDYFTDASGNMNKELPEMHWDVVFKPKGNMTNVNLFLTFKSLEDLETIIKMGFKEGIAIAMEGLDELFAEMKKES